MLIKNKRVITVATNAELLNEHYYRRLWIAARNIEIPRRAWLDEFAACFRDCRCKIVYPSGEVFSIPYVDELFGDDQDMRWLSYYLSVDEAGFAPRSRCRKLDRVQVIDLYFRIKYPYIAEHFGV